MADAGGRDDVKWGVAVAIGIILWALVRAADVCLYIVYRCGLTVFVYSVPVCVAVLGREDVRVHWVRV